MSSHLPLIFIFEVKMEWLLTPGFRGSLRGPDPGLGTDPIAEDDEVEEEDDEDKDEEEDEDCDDDPGGIGPTLLAGPVADSDLTFGTAVTVRTS